MAEIRTVRLVDDTDGTDAVETVEFALDGRDYQIDLSSANSTALRDSLAPYIAAGRRSARGRRPAPQAAPVTRSGSRGAEARRESNAIREWARQRGHQVSDRGRIAKPVVEAYYAENGTGGVMPQFADASA